MGIYKSPQIWVITSKYSYMQAISDLARNGYRHYTQGEFPIEKTIKAYESLIRKYPLFTDKNSVFQARKRGEPVGRLLLYRSAPKIIHFTMMFDATDSQIQEIYKKNGSDLPKSVDNKWKRLSFSTYELAKHVRKFVNENSKKTNKGASSWTWQYKKDEIFSLRARLNDSINRGHIEEAKKILISLSYAPGFAGVRSQLLEAYEDAKRQWLRKFGPKSPLKTKPVIYIRRIEQKGVFLTEKLIAKELQRLEKDESQKLLNLNYDQKGFTQDYVDGLAKKANELHFFKD